VTTYSVVADVRVLDAPAPLTELRAQILEHDHLAKAAAGAARAADQGEADAA